MVFFLGGRQHPIVGSGQNQRERSPTETAYHLVPEQAGYQTQLDSTSLVGR